MRITLEYPVAEFAPHREDAPEEPLIAQLLQLEKARQPELVLYHAVLDARLLRGGVKLPCLGERRGDRFFAVDVLTCGDRALEELRPQLRRRSVEENFIGTFERRIEIRRPARHAVLTRQLLHLGCVAPDEERIRNQARAILERNAALL